MYGVPLLMMVLVAFGIRTFGPVFPEPWLLAMTPAIPARIVLVSSTRSGRSTTYLITYCYQPPSHDEDGVTEGSNRITEGEYHDLYRKTSVMIHVGRIGPFPVATLDRSPGEYLRTRGFEWFFLLFASGLFWTLLIGTWTNQRRARRLLRDGEPASGRITGKSILRRRSTASVVAYEYRLPGVGPESFRRGRVTVPKRAYERAGEGQPIVIVYDPADPGRHVVYEFCDYVVDGAVSKQA